MNDSNLNKQIEKLHKINIYGRWLFVLICWITLAPFGLWEMRETISLCQQYCTRSTIKYGLQFNPFGAVAITFCIAITTAVLIRQSIYILKGGLSPKEKFYLEKQVRKIQAKGPKHFLWKWVFNSKD